MTFTEHELRYLAEQVLGRLATVDAHGAVQNNPVGFQYNAGTGTIDIGGYNMGATRKFRNVLATGRAALVVDDVASFKPWKVRGIEIRGRAEALSDQENTPAGMSAELIRVHPEKIISWGVDPTAERMTSRKAG
ncbi:PPOX class F420-dependent oxidoreductase [Allokutzneria sp. A3M-2-11 16]|uniref:PPOX class F420-dependent oxidoreductase n=1 Tax=Allokutzneria sp. A3M-2-11 16 TaxID=2962043 RepID=UPI0020B6D2D2|nr:PPOX class F420-dependent oxidoreductase [Allokutzneria sp. A3M-2-11 16]MCP3799446.1 PPOX class F420-dependent oxidoreductase [Allokutzneria sp. A3M-2-11 16]